MIPRRAAVILPVAAALTIAAGWLLPDPLRGRVWLAGLVFTGFPIVFGTLRGLLHGRFAADVVATLAIVAAVVFVQPFAGLVIVLMQSGGEALEAFAGGRASRAVRELEAAAPRVAHRFDAAGELSDVAVAEIVPGDSLLVRPGDKLPCDAVVADGYSHVDTSSLTGEPVPVTAKAGVTLPSGAVNQDGALTVTATARADESQYARIVELVRSAQASQAPIQRLADRYAVWFTPLTLLVCLAAWLASHDPLRVLAVLVVATPCPLILATPVAIIGGINRAARGGILFRTGGALEQLARVDAVAFDKTGTITVGRPAVAGVRVADGWSADDVLRLAAAVEQSSGHLLARSVVDAAQAAGLSRATATAVTDAPGRGVSGTVDGRLVSVGAAAWIAERHPSAVAGLAELDGRSDRLAAAVAIDGAAAGFIDYADQLRPNIGEVLARLAALGVGRVLLISGDATGVVASVARAVGIRDARGDLLPADKVAVVEGLQTEGRRVLMVGDGVNDAPALAAAEVGVAMAGHGEGITAEAADVVLLSDDLSLVPSAVETSRRTIRIARESIVVGLGLSAVAMGFAAAGYIAPAVGALLQEGIDVVVILNALRTAADRP